MNTYTFKPEVLLDKNKNRYVISQTIVEKKRFLNEISFINVPMHSEVFHE